MCVPSFVYLVLRNGARVPQDDDVIRPGSSSDLTGFYRVFFSVTDRLVSFFLFLPRWNQRRDGVLACSLVFLPSLTGFFFAFGPSRPPCGCGRLEFRAIVASGFLMPRFCVVFPFSFLCFSLGIRRKLGVAPGFRWVSAGPFSLKKKRNSKIPTDNPTTTTTAVFLSNNNNNNNTDVKPVRSRGANPTGRGPLNKLRRSFPPQGEGWRVVEREGVVEGGGGGGRRKRRKEGRRGAGRGTPRSRARCFPRFFPPFFAVVVVVVVAVVVAARIESFFSSLQRCRFGT